MNDEKKNAFTKSGGSPPTPRKLSWQYEDLAFNIQLAPRQTSATNLLRFLAKAANDGGTSHHGYASLMAHCGIRSRSSIADAVKYLLTVRVDDRPILTRTKGGIGKETSHYKLHLGAMQKLVEHQNIFDVETGKRIYRTVPEGVPLNSTPTEEGYTAEQGEGVPLNGTGGIPLNGLGCTAESNSNPQVTLIKNPQKKPLSKAPAESSSSDDREHNPDKANVEANVDDNGVDLPKLSGGSRWCLECNGELVEAPKEHICPHCQRPLAGVLRQPCTTSEGYLHMHNLLDGMEESEREAFYKGPLTATQREWVANCEGAGPDGYYARELKYSDEQSKTAALLKRYGVDEVEPGQPEPKKKGPRGHSMEIPGIKKPRITLQDAKRAVEELEDGQPYLVCTKCLQVGNFDGLADGCTARDEGSICGGTAMKANQWLAQLEAEWRVYNAQVRASNGISLQEVVGRLNQPAMMIQPEITNWINAEQVDLKTVAELRLLAKELYDTQSREPLRKAWYLYASGMLDDNGDEREPWVTKLFADFEALQSRYGESK